MGQEVEIITDGDGVAVIGEPTAVERFLDAVGLSTSESAVDFASALRKGALAAHSGAEVMAESGRQQGATGLGTAKRLGGEGRNQAAAVGKKLSGRIGGLRRRAANADEDADEE